MLALLHRVCVFWNQRMTEDNNKFGIVYIVSGEFHTAAASQSAISVRTTNPELDIDIFTDVAADENLFDKVHKIPTGHMRSKVDWLPKSRFEKTLYLDSDTRVVDDITPLAELLDRFDIALAHGHQRHGARQNIFWNESIPASFPQINGGVILYSGRPNVRAFLEHWSRSYHKAGFKWDQITLREIMWKSDLRLYILPPEYNVRYEKYLEIWTEEEATPKILHFARFYEELEADPIAPRRLDTTPKARLKRFIKSVRRLMKI
jgi:hypothetical protein